MKKSYLVLCVLLSIAFVFPQALYASTSVLPVFGGGTGVNGFGQGWIFSTGGTSALAASTSPTVNYITATSTTATSTFANGIRAKCFSTDGINCISGGGGGSGTVTQVNTTYPITGGGFTTSGTLALAFGTTTANTWSLLNSFNNATSTLFTSTTAWIGTLNLTNALTVANGGTGLSTIGASSTVLTANGTSATWQKLDLAAAIYGILPIANGGTNDSGISYVSNGIVVYNGTQLGGYSGYTLSSSLLRATNASTTNLSVNSTNVVGDGSGTSLITPLRAFTATSPATTTAWTGSTTVLDIGAAPFGMTINTARCHTDAGTLNVQLQYGTGPTKPAMLFASSTIGTQTFSSNNTPAKGDDLAIVFGTPASSPTQISCTFSGPQTSI